MKRHETQKATAVPPRAEETVRHRIVDLLRESPLSAREISGAAHIPEKEVFEHLEHIRRSSRHGKLEVRPAACRTCGFVFAKRERLTPPGKCPSCKSEFLLQPLFFITPR